MCPGVVANAGNLKGIEAVAVIGIVGRNADKKLEVLSDRCNALG